MSEKVNHLLAHFKKFYTNPHEKFGRTWEGVIDYSDITKQVEQLIPGKGNELKVQRRALYCDMIGKLRQENFRLVMTGKLKSFT